MKSSDEVSQKQKILHLYLKKYKNKCDEKCEKSVAKLLKTAEARAIEGIVESANLIASIGKENWEITQKDLETAATRTNETEKAFDKKEVDQATKTLIAQEHAATWTTRAAVAGTVEVTVGWKNVLKKSTSAIVYFGKAGIDFYTYGKQPNFSEIFHKIAKDTLFEEAKASNDKQQK